MCPQSQRLLDHWESHENNDIITVIFLLFLLFLLNFLLFSIFNIIEIFFKNFCGWTVSLQHFITWWKTCQRNWYFGPGFIIYGWKWWRDTSFKTMLGNYNCIGILLAGWKSEKRGGFLVLSWALLVLGFGVGWGGVGRF